MKKIIYVFLLSVFLTACGSEDSAKTRTGSAPTDQVAFKADDFNIITPIPQSMANEYNLDTNYYNKAIVVWGFPVLSPANVDDALLRNAAEIVALQLSNDNLQEGIQKSIRDKLFQHYFRVVIYSTNGYKYGSQSVPEYSGWADAAGYGATKQLPMTGASEFSLDYPLRNGNTYKGNSLIHELTHSIHLLALGDLIPNFDSQLKASYNNAINSRLWAGGQFDIGNGMGYISKDYLEYLAVGSELWNNVRRSEAKHDPDDNRTLHEYLRDTDYSLYSILDSFYSGSLTLNPEAGMYKELYKFECPIDTPEGIFTFDRLSYNLYLDGELFSISKLTSDEWKNTINNNLFTTPGLTPDGREGTALFIPHPLYAPDSYVADEYKLEVFLDGNLASTCEMSKSNLKR